MASPLSWIFDDAANTGWNEPNHDMLGNGFGWGQCSHLLAWVFHVCGGGGDDGDDSLTTPMEVYCRMNHSDKTGADVAHAATIVCNDNNIVMSMSGTSLLPGNAHSHPPVGKRFHIEIHGTHGALLYCGDDQIPSSGRLELRRSDGSVELPAGDEFYFEDLNQDGDGPNSLQSFIRACNNHEDYYVGADSHLGLKTVRVLDAMYRSHVTKSAASIY
jgi:predicted dehydrogenase